jgi:hypothetical protein
MFFALKKGFSSDKRIGPHNIDILSFIIGSLLGDSHIEKCEKGIGSRFIIEQCQQNIQYLH